VTQCACWKDKEFWRANHNTEVELDFEVAVYEWGDGVRDIDWECHFRRPCGMEERLSFDFMFGSNFATRDDLSIYDILVMIDRKIGKHCASYHGGVFVLYDEAQANTPPVLWPADDDPRIAEPWAAYERAKKEREK